jgi:hypothetical protein
MFARCRSRSSFNLIVCSHRMILSVYGTPTLNFFLKNSFVWRAMELTFKITVSVAATSHRCIDAKIVMVLKQYVINASYTYISGNHITGSRYDDSNPTDIIFTFCCSIGTVIFSKRHHSNPSAYAFNLDTALVFDATTQLQLSTMILLSLTSMAFIPLGLISVVAKPLNFTLLNFCKFAYSLRLQSNPRPLQHSEHLNISRSCPLSPKHLPSSFITPLYD